MTTSLIVNLYGGPGAGKSTLAAMLYAHIKAMGPAVSVELAPEYAKELVMDRNRTALATQEHVLGEQRMRIERLAGQIDVIITDGPFLNSAIYLPEGYPQSFVDFVIWCHRRHASFNIFVERPEMPYEPTGRYHTEEEAHAIDARVLTFLERNAGTILHRARPSFRDAAVLARTIMASVLGGRGRGTLPAESRETWSAGLP